MGGGARHERVHAEDVKHPWELEELRVMELRGFCAGCDPWAMSCVWVHQQNEARSFSATSITLTLPGLPAGFLTLYLCCELHAGAADAGWRRGFLLLLSPNQ